MENIYLMLSVENVLRFFYYPISLALKREVVFAYGVPVGALRAFLSVPSYFEPSSEPVNSIELFQHNGFR